MITVVGRALERCEWKGSTAVWALTSCVAFARAKCSTTDGIAGLRDVLSAAVRRDKDNTVATYVCSSRQQQLRCAKGMH